MLALLIIGLCIAGLIAVVFVNSSQPARRRESREESQTIGQQARVDPPWQ